MRTGPGRDWSVGFEMPRRASHAESHGSGMTKRLRRKVAQRRSAHCCCAFAVGSLFWMEPKVSL